MKLSIMINIENEHQIIIQVTKKKLHQNIVKTSNESDSNPTLKIFKDTSIILP